MIIEGYSTKRKTTFRVNSLKSNVDEIEEILDKNKISYNKVSWYKDAFILDEATENDIKKLKIYEKGKIYLQSLSSMIPALILKPQFNENILDMAAAPGGKTTQISAITNNMALITACEKNKIRAERLKYNIEKQGATKITILTEDSRNLSDYFSFDRILLDSPCSGSGTLNINDKDIENFTEEFVNRLVKVQQALLKKAIKLLKPGHEMIYSTCSILKDENEDIIDKILQNCNVEIIPIQIELLKDIPLIPTNISGTICVCPTELYEGFFVAKLIKKDVN